MIVVGDVSVEIGNDHVATVEIHRPPNNFFSMGLIEEIADAFESLDASGQARAIVLCSEGRHFCAGADFANRSPNETSLGLYAAGVRLFRTGLPVVAAVQGAAIGGGLGLALMPDFRVTAPEARFSANFAQLGFHQGFGLSVTLPRLVGQQVAAELLYTGRRVTGDEAVAMGLADRLAPLESVRESAHEMAAEIAASAPLAVRSIRATLRQGLADAIKAATDHEAIEQARLQGTADWKEGVAAMAERRTPNFQGK